MANPNIRITADTNQAQAAIQGLNQRLASIEKSVASVNRSLGSMKTALSGVISALAGGALGGFIDDLQNMQQKLRIATGSQAEFNQAMDMVKAIADKTGQSLSATGDLYASVARNAEKLGYSQDQVTTVTNAMATALKASGTSAQGAASVMYQFSQILAKGKVNGDEFTTIMENLGGPVMDLVAKNMGVTTAELLKLKEQGLIGAKDFTDALIRSMGELDKMTGKAGTTIGQSMQRIQNAFATTILAIDNATGFSTTFAEVANKISANGENLIPVIKAIGLALGALAVYFAPVITLFGAAAAAALYFADVLGPILKPVIETVEKALGFIVKRLVGFGAAIAAAVSGKNPFEAYNRALEEFDKKAEKATTTATEGQKKLAQATATATAQTSAQAGQLTGVADKYNEILRKVQEELKISGMTQEQQKIGAELLKYKEQLQGKMTAAQEAELTALLKNIEANKQTAQLKQDILRATKESEMALQQIGIQDLNLREQQAAVDRYRLQVKRDLTAEEEAQVRAAVKNQQAARDLLAIEQARRQLLGEITKEQAIQRGVGVQQRMNPQGALNTEYKLDMEALNAHLDAKLINEQAYQEAVMRLKREYTNKSNELYIQQIQDEKRQRETQIVADQMRMGKTYEQAKTYAEFEMKTTAEKTQFALDQASQMFSTLGTQNKKAFEAAKAFNIANAIMNTYLSVTKALASYPFPFSLIAAGAALAAGMAQVGQIRSQQYSGRALGGPVMSGQSYVVGERGPELFTPSTSGKITRNQDIGTQPVSINFNISTVDAQGFDDLLVQRKGVIQSIISDAMLERGQRGI